MNTSISRDSVLHALQGVVAPSMIQDLVIQPDGEISLKVLNDKVEADVRKAILSINGVKKVQIQLAVRGTDQAGPSRSKQPQPGPIQKGVQPIEGVKHIIAVSSGKGGVGKSTVAVNLATSLALDGARVGLMDADVYGPNIPTMMGVIGQPKIEQHPERGDLFVPPIAHGVKVMSMGFLIDPDQPLVWRGPMLHSIVSQFCHKVNWGELDYLIVDMPPGTGDVQLSLSQLVPLSGAILVTTPQEVSVQDVRKAYIMFEKVRVPVLGIVENMSYFICDEGKRYDLFGKGGGEAIAQKFAVPLLSQIPIVMNIREGGDVGRPVVVQYPESSVSKAFCELARKASQAVEAAHTAVGEGIEIGMFH